MNPLTTSAAEARAFGVRCHCAGDDAGHAPGAPGFECVPIKVVRVQPGTVGGSTTYGGYGAGAPLRPYKARGTCPGCGAARPVERFRVHGTLPTGNRIPLAIEPRVAEHRVKGWLCAGGIPTELTFRPGTEVAGWAAVHGEDSIERARGW